MAVTQAMFVSSSDGSKSGLLCAGFRLYFKFTVAIILTYLNTIPFFAHLNSKFKNIFLRVCRTFAAI